MDCGQIYLTMLLELLLNERNYGVQDSFFFLERMTLCPTFYYGQEVCSLHRAKRFTDIVKKRPPAKARDSIMILHQHCELGKEMNDLNGHKLVNFISINSVIILYTVMLGF